MFYYFDFRENGQRYFCQCKTTLDIVATGVIPTQLSNSDKNTNNLKKCRIRTKIDVNDTISICILCKHSGSNNAKSDLVEESLNPPAYYISCWKNSKKMREVTRLQINSKEFLYFTMFGTNSTNCRFRLFPQ